MDFLYTEGVVMLKKAVFAFIAVLVAFVAVSAVGVTQASASTGYKKMANNAYYWKNGQKVWYYKKPVAKKVSYAAAHGGWKKPANVAMVHPNMGHGGHGYGGMMANTDGKVWLSTSIRNGATCHVAYTENGHPPAYQYRTAFPCASGGTWVGGLVPGQSYRFQISPDHMGWSGEQHSAVAMAQ